MGIIDVPLMYLKQKWTKIINETEKSTIYSSTKSNHYRQDGKTVDFLQSPNIKLMTQISYNRTNRGGNVELNNLR